MLRWTLGGAWDDRLNETSKVVDESEVDDESGYEIEQEVAINGDEIRHQESWIDWMRRHTQIAEKILRTLQIDDWRQRQEKIIGSLNTEK